MSTRFPSKGNRDLEMLFEVAETVTNNTLRTHALPDGFDPAYARDCQWSCARCGRSVDECLQSVCIDPDDAHERRILNLFNFDYKGD